MEHGTCTMCDEPARGYVEASEAAPAHYCRQCEEHCQIAAHLSAGLAFD